MATHEGKRVQDKGQVKPRRAKSSASRAKPSTKRIKVATKVVKVATKVVKVAHDKCGDARLDYALFPIGFKYNENLQGLRRGDIVQFLDGSEHYVWSVVRVSLKSAIAEYLCWMRYGFGIARAVELWHERVKLQRLNVKVISDSECLVLFFDKEEVRYEQRRKE